MHWLNRVFWKFLKKIGVWDTCPNCESAWSGGHPNPEDQQECIICGQNKKEQMPNGWVWGWIEPSFLRSRILQQRIDKANYQEKQIDRLQFVLRNDPVAAEKAAKTLGVKNINDRELLRLILQRFPDLNKKLEKLPEDLKPAPSDKYAALRVAVEACEFSTDPWKWYHGQLYDGDNVILDCADGRPFIVGGYHTEDAYMAHIAAAHPAIIRDLLAERDALRKTINYSF